MIREEEILPFIVNVHNLLTLHATILFCNQRDTRLNFMKKAVYNIGAKEFSLLELESIFIRGNTVNPNVYGNHLIIL